MNPIAALFLVIAALAATQVAAPPAAAPANSDVDVLLDRWQKEVTGLKSFTCKFRQEKKVSFMRRPLVSTGSLKFRDRKILWVTDQPSASFLSFDGKEARIYHPEFNTLEIYSLASMGGMGGNAAAGPDASAPPPSTGTPSAGTAVSPAAGGSSSFMKGGMPGFTGDFGAMRKQYDVELLPAADGDTSHHLRFTPRDPEVKKTIASIEFKLDAALVIQEWRLVQANGDELRLTITEFNAHAKVEESDLKFAVPDGVKIVRMGADEKPAPEKGGGP